MSSRVSRTQGRTTDNNEPSGARALQPLSLVVWLRRLIIALTILAWMAIGAVVLALVGRMIGTVLMFVMATLLAYVIYPLVLLLQRYVPRWLAVVLVYLVVLGACLFLLYAIVASVVGQLTSLVLYVQFLLGLQGQQQLQPVIELFNQLGISRTQLNAFGEQITSQLQSFVAQVIPVLGGVANGLISVIVIAVLSIYLLLDGGRAVDWLRNKTPLGQRETITFLVTTVNQIIGGYLRGLLLLATIAGGSTGIVLALLGVPYAALLAVVVFVSLFIPVIGGIISGALCILLSLPQGWVTAMIVTIFVVLLHELLIGQLLSPRILGDAVRIHPVIAILALFAGTELLGVGVLGGFLAVPLVGIGQAVLVLLWNRWKDTHPEQFPPSL